MKQHVSGTARLAKLLAAAVVLPLSSVLQPALAAEDLDLRLPPVALPVQPVVDTTSLATAPNSPPPSGDLIATFDAFAAHARATQPNWSTPLITTTVLLERRLRFDLSQQRSGNGTNTTVI